jgi:hypothetical protein
LLSAFVVVTGVSVKKGWPTLDRALLAALHIPMRRADGWYRFIRFSGPLPGFYDIAD